MFGIVHLDANYLVANSVKKSAKLTLVSRQNDGLTLIPLDIIPSSVCLVRKLGYHRIYHEELAAMSSHYNLVLR